MEQNLLYVTEALSAILTEDQSTDRVLQKIFQLNRSTIKSRDRREVAELVYNVLRRFGLYEAALKHIGQFSNWDVYLMAALCDLARQERAHLFDEIKAPVLFSSPIDFSQRLKQHFPAVLAAIRTRPWTDLTETLAFPQWMARILEADYGSRRAEGICGSLAEPAPLTIRVNTLKTDRDKLQKKLKGEDIETSKTLLSPDGLTCLRKAALAELPSFKSGLFEVQDEGSQLLSLLLNPKPGEQILDACAGSGGKTLHLAALAEDKSSITAMDIAEAKLAELKRRLTRAGLKSVRVKTAKQEALPESLYGTFDKVLVDAPCSGSGVFRRHPEKKWQFKEEALPAVAIYQIEVLSHYSAALKPGGILLYATCSIFREENDRSVAQFLESHPDFELLPLQEALAGGPLQSVAETLLKEDANYFRILPDTTDKSRTDGFFAAILTRTS